MIDKTIRVGFVGAGKNTQSRHIPGFRKLSGVELVAVANRTKESGERVAREFDVAFLSTPGCSSAQPCLWHRYPAAA